jgi:hypothetical protein
VTPLTLDTKLAARIVDCEFSILPLICQTIIIERLYERNTDSEDKDYWQSADGWWASRDVRQRAEMLLDYRYNVTLRE